MSVAERTAGKPRRPATAKKWTCDACGVAVSRAGGGRVALPESWESGPDGTYCLGCRRERAAESALAAAADSPLAERARLRRSALIEFEVRRRPQETDGVIAKSCRSSVAAVAAARRRLNLPEAPPPGSGRPPRG